MRGLLKIPFIFSSTIVYLYSEPKIELYFIFLYLKTCIYLKIISHVFVYTWLLVNLKSNATLFRLMSAVDPTSIIALIGLAMNTCAIIYMCSRKRFKKSYDIVYLNLAITDLAFAISGVLYFLIWDCEDGEDMTCKIWGNFFGQFIQLINQLSLLPLVIDRLQAVIYATEYNSSKRYRLVLSTCWITATIWILLYYIFASKDDIEVNKKISPIFHKAEIAVFYILPTIFNIISFVFIFHTLSKYRSNIPRKRINLIINVAKAFLTTIAFTSSWFPIFVNFHILGNLKPNLYICFYINTLCDPIFYLIPNQIIIKTISKVSVKAGRATYTRRTEREVIMTIE